MVACSWVASSLMGHKLHVHFVTNFSYNHPIRLFIAKRRRKIPYLKLDLDTWNCFMWDHTIGLLRSALSTRQTSFTLPASWDPLAEEWPHDLLQAKHRLSTSEQWDLSHLMKLPYIVRPLVSSALTARCPPDFHHFQSKNLFAGDAGDWSRYFLQAIALCMSAYEAALFLTMVNPSWHCLFCPAMDLPASQASAILLLFVIV